MKKILLVLSMLLFQSHLWAQAKDAKASYSCYLQYLDKNYSNGTTESDMKKILLKRSNLLAQPSLEIIHQEENADYLVTVMPVSVTTNTEVGNLTILHAEIKKSYNQSGKFVEFYAKGALVLTSEAGATATFQSTFDQMSDFQMQVIGVTCQRPK